MCLKRYSSPIVKVWRKILSTGLEIFRNNRQAWPWLSKDCDHTFAHRFLKNCYHPENSITHLVRYNNRNPLTTMAVRRERQNAVEIQLPVTVTKKKKQTVKFTCTIITGNVDRFEKNTVSSLPPQAPEEIRKIRPNIKKAPGGADILRCYQYHLQSPSSSINPRP